MTDSDPREKHSGAAPEQPPRGSHRNTVTDGETFLRAGLPIPDDPAPSDPIDPPLCAFCGKEGASYQMDSAIPYCDEACFEADNEQEGDADDE